MEDFRDVKALNRSAAMKAFVYGGCHMERWLKEVAVEGEGVGMAALLQTRCRISISSRFDVGL